MRILFLCTGNSARSQMAEGLMRHKGGPAFEVLSAGTQPQGLNPLSVEVMKEIGIDISSHRSKNVSTLTGLTFDLVITVCDQARESCPVIPGAEMLHWNVPDPTDLDSFRKVRDELSNRVEDLLEHLG